MGQRIFGNPSYGMGFARSPGESESPYLFRGLAGAWVSALGIQGAGLFDVSGGNNKGIATGTQWDVNKSGTVLAHTATSDSVSFGPSDKILPLQGVTIIVGYEKRDATLRASGAFGNPDTSDSLTRCGVHLPWTDSTVYWDFGGQDSSHRLSVGGLTFGDDVWAFTTGSRGMEIWQNGILRNSNSANPSRSSTTSPFKLGTHADTISDLANYSCLYVYKSQIPVNAIKKISYDLLAPLRMRQQAPFFVSAVGPAAGYPAAYFDNYNIGQPVGMM